MAIDYRRTARRLGWETVPVQAVRALEGSLGRSVVGAGPPAGSGFGGQYAGTLTLDDHSRVFVKAAPPWIAYQAGCLLMEEAILHRLPTTVPHSRVVGRASALGWELLALEQVDGSMPGFPWTTAHLGAAYASCSALGEVPEPRALTDRQWAEHFHRDDCHGADIAGLRDGSYRRPAEHGVDPWLEAMVTVHGAEIADLADSSRTVTGEALLHNDLRPDNLLINDAGQAVLLDWNWVCVGPPWLDFLGLLPMAHRQGLPVRPWLEAPLFAGADDATIDAVLGAIAVKMLGGQDEALAPGLPETVWEHKLVHACDAVRLLADRRGWADPAPAGLRSGCAHR